MSNDEPAVVTVAVPLDDAVQLNHTDAPPELPAIAGSSVSFVAPTFVPVIVPLAPERAIALAKSSFPGAFATRATAVAGRTSSTAATTAAEIPRR